jgi:hypothetical protein
MENSNNPYLTPQKPAVVAVAAKAPRRKAVFASFVFFNLLAAYVPVVLFMVVQRTFDHKLFVAVPVWLPLLLLGRIGIPSNVNADLLVWGLFSAFLIFLVFVSWLFCRSKIAWVLMPFGMFLLDWVQMGMFTKFLRSLTMSSP